MGREDISDYIDYLAFVNGRRDSLLRTQLLDVLRANSDDILGEDDDA